MLDVHEFPPGFTIVVQSLTPKRVAKYMFSAGKIDISFWLKQRLHWGYTEFVAEVDVCINASLDQLK